MKTSNLGMTAMMQRQALTAANPKLPKVDPEKSGDPEAIRDVAKQFESVFLHQVFKSMRSTIPKDGMLNSGFGGEVFTDMLDQKYAEVASNSSSFGLADTIARQLMGGEEVVGRDPTPAIPIRRLGANKAYAEQKQSTHAWTMPINGRVSSDFGMRRLHDEQHARLHGGIDFAAPTGTPIQAARDGEVLFAGTRGGYGNTVVIDHGGKTETLYAHASELLVKAGDKVRAGDEIAKVGSTGRSTGPHLHFEIREGGKRVDPGPLLGVNHKH